MHTKIYQLLYTFTFSVEYLSRLTLNHKITKSCGTFCRIDDANVSNLILIIRHSFIHRLLRQQAAQTKTLKH